MGSEIWVIEWDGTSVADLSGLMEMYGGYLIVSSETRSSAEFTAKQWLKEHGYNVTRIRSSIYEPVKDKRVVLYDKEWYLGAEEK